MDYAIIKIGNKQHRVRDGETLVVDRVGADEGKTFTPDVLLGEGPVTAKVVAHERGPKIRIGKYRRRTGYRRHNGFRAATSRLEISFGGAKRSAPRTEEAAPAPKPAEAAAPETAAPAEGEHVKGMPSGYEEMTVAQITEASKSWNRPMLEAALEYEQANAKRKGAISALEHALAAKEES
jgi:large subunit ribosomal protein L21